MDTPDAYAELADALRRRRAVIADRAFYERDPGGHLEELKRVSERIIVLQRDLPAAPPAQLAHFLERCSYDKALTFIEENMGARG